MIGESWARRSEGCHTCIPAPTAVSKVRNLFSLVDDRMAQSSTIEWTDATWNPITGCTKISAGCDHCYAETFSERFRGVSGHHFEHGFDLTLRPERLSQPLSWKGRKFVFVNSMSDLFHKEVPRSFIDKVFDVMEACPHHVFQVLTKRSPLMKKYIQSRYRGQMAPKHIWLGTTVENAQAKSRIRHLRDTPAGTRFLSLEPLLGPLGSLDLTGIDWAIVGGESGNGAREMKPEWVREILDQCGAQGTLFFFKQWGRFGPEGKPASKKKNGRLFGGREYNDRPEID